MDIVVKFDLDGDLRRVRLFLPPAETCTNDTSRLLPATNAAFEAIVGGAQSAYGIDCTAKRTAFVMWYTDP
eukprot:NODE_17583_length_935_cov_6.410891.p4 GENE.NODE_17583_length_935_cov_6.410891~~NODE_17583_length_935_cov_6.410891.p4  ORF type:complete len:71 (+),score=18.65 NODE_17583_length_935_cov_6.410891:72-284(+)